MSVRPHSPLRWLVLSAVLFAFFVSGLATWWPSDVASGQTVQPSNSNVERAPTAQVQTTTTTPQAQVQSRPSAPTVVAIQPQDTPLLTPRDVSIEPQPWLPPTPQERVFDLNADGRVGRDERERAAEILELANQFAANRSLDGTFPILKEAFRGEARLFKAMDGDGDGALSAREWVSFHVDSIREVRRFDQNADGAATLAEMGVAASRFDYLDFDHDGLIWAWEIDLQRGRGKW